MRAICTYLKASSFGCTRACVGCIARAQAHVHAHVRTHARSVHCRILWTSRCTCNTSRRREPAIATTTRNQRLRHLRMRRACVHACVRACMHACVRAWVSEWVSECVATRVFVTVRFIVLRMFPSTFAVSYIGCSKNVSINFSTSRAEFSSLINSNYFHENAIIWN